MADTNIQWTDSVWNPTTGCDKVSPGCDHCYALTMAKRLKGMGQEKYQNDGDPRTSGPGFALTVHPDALTIPMRWKKPRRVFVNSMSDLFHPRVPDDFLARVFGVMAGTRRHTYQVLTKRAPRMRALLNNDAFIVKVGASEWPLPNVWLGVSAEDQVNADVRIPLLLDTPAAVRWVSAEPLIGSLDLTRYLLSCPEWRLSYPEPTSPAGVFIRGLLEHPGLSWVVVGGESGHGARPMRLEWAQSIVADCRNAGVPVFVKQLGAVWGHAFGSDAKGANPKHWPEELRVREYPSVDSFSLLGE